MLSAAGPVSARPHCTGMPRKSAEENERGLTTTICTLPQKHVAVASSSLDHLSSTNELLGICCAEACGSYSVVLIIVADISSVRVRSKRSVSK